MLDSLLIEKDFLLPTLNDPMPRSLRNLKDDSRKSAAPGQVQNILVVDDSLNERSIIRMAVEALTKFRICGEASNGTEAVKKATELKPDLIIMDLAMPLMNGLEAASVLKSALPGIPVVLFTLYGDLVRSERSPTFGITHVVSKGDGIAPLLDCVKNLLDPLPGPDSN
jgi:DNA-binding NarL/FixJ family response regulator